MNDAVQAGTWKGMSAEAMAEVLLNSLQRSNVAVDSFRFGLLNEFDQLI